MITAYVVTAEKLERVDLQHMDPMPQGTVWLDLYEPTEQEEAAVKRALSINIPTRAEMDKIEVMSPFYKEGNAHHMTVTALDRSSTEHTDSTAVTFILTADYQYLITLHYSRPRSILNFAARAMRSVSLCSSAEIALSGIMDAMVSKIADVLEEIGNDLDKLLRSIFANRDKQTVISSRAYNTVIRKIGYTGNLISKNRESLVSINRLLIYWGQVEDARYTSRREQKMRFRHLAREVSSLSEYANFLSQRNGFLLDATLGMISVEQSTIIKMFTVAATVLMPPTLIASVYGMNFKYMPELDFWLGYPMALIFMAVSALLPFFFFKKKKWI